ncbi:twin-arginine translocation signal domain-containing protein [Ferrimonas marina]|uniref:Formate dehydrogenase region TAT target n=1 Tax=Ferrimonas marina TaxID=299255 RepID=A0A1M5XWW6_9GAMM|nr:twin-arginine translocation signal domain-containing protein [Ferrimonas marina]SHI04028.1 formate dehydrogenase region TAT target [Ferrimonas marina]
MNKKPEMARRQFLKTVAAGSAVGVAAAAVSPAALADTPKVEAKDGIGYRETDHIRNYYAVARGQ